MTIRGLKLELPLHEHVVRRRRKLKRICEGPLYKGEPQRSFIGPKSVRASSPGKIGSRICDGSSLGSFEYVSIVWCNVRLGNIQDLPLSKQFDQQRRFSHNSSHVAKNWMQWCTFSTGPEIAVALNLTDSRTTPVMYQSHLGSFVDKIINRRRCTATLTLRTTNSAEASTQ